MGAGFAPSPSPPPLRFACGRGNAHTATHFPPSRRRDAERGLGAGFALSCGERVRVEGNGVEAKNRAPLTRGGCGGFPHTPLEAFASLTLSVRDQRSECQSSESQKKGQLLNENRY
jgi:hypothetical protein